MKLLLDSNHHHHIRPSSLPAHLSGRPTSTMAPKKAATTVEVALVPLKNCLVNLPPVLVNMLVNANHVCSSMRLRPYITSLISYLTRNRLPKMSLSSSNTVLPPPLEVKAALPASAQPLPGGLECRARDALPALQAEIPCVG